MASALGDLTIIDFSRILAGPMATMVLADLGATVIKIERPGVGDLSRTSIADDPDGLDNPVFRSLNRNKRSIALDLRGEAGKAVVYDLAKTADVVVNNFRAGVMERMGFGWEELSKRNPRLIYAVGTGYGLTGPYAHKGGQDVLAQAMSGVMYRRSNDDQPLAVNATTFADYSAGMHMVQGILLALLQREKTGRGQQITVSLLDSMLAAQTQEACAHLMRGKEVNWGAMPLSGVFETSDGALVMVGAFKADPLGDISKALEIDHLGKDERFKDFAAQVANKKALQDIFRARYRTNTTDYWLKRLEEVDLLCAPVRSLAEALADEQAVINEMIMEADGEVERVRVVGSPIHMSEAKVSIRIPPASLGRHTDAVRAEVAAAKRQAAE